MRERYIPDNKRSGLTLQTLPMAEQIFDFKLWPWKEACKVSDWVSTAHANEWLMSEEKPVTYKYSFLPAVDKGRLVDKKEYL